MSICAGRLFPVLTSSYMLRAAVCEYRRFSPVYVCQIPFEIFSASSAPVHTCWPFHATTVAVPVSWQNGSSNCAETTAFLRSAVAMNLSFGEAPGSDRMAATCCWCFGRRRNDTSRIASCARTVRAFGSTTRTGLPANFAFFTKPFAPATRRYFVSSLPVWKGFEYTNPFFAGDFGAVFFADFFFAGIGVSSSVEITRRRGGRL